jgi:hypothetical protein
MSNNNYPKNDSEVSALVGKVIQFNAEVEKCEIDFDRGMKARVVGFAITNPEEVFKLDLDFSEFEESNKLLMQSNYFDKNHNPTLKWCETKFYPKNCRCHDYFGYKYEGSNCFEVVEG